MHKRVLISNRGEIAIRIAKSATALGMESVGVYPAIDVLSLHTRCMTESHEIGTAQDAVGAYLNAEAIIQIAKASGCDCLHPGYGFLSENVSFAKILEENKIKFIGPSSKLIKMMGDKIEAKKIAKQHGLPIIEGSTVATKHGHVKTDHMLFIAAGAFHMSKPSDLIPELQGRFPIRVELDALEALELPHAVQRVDHQLSCAQLSHMTQGGIPDALGRLPSLLLEGPNGCHTTQFRVLHLIYAVKRY